MNEWQKRFAQKLETVQSVARDRFEQKADDTVTPVYREFAEFIRQYVVQATTPLTDFGIRTYRFAMSEDVYLLMTFRHMGFEQCEVQVEYFVPGSSSLPPKRERVTLSDMNVSWCRNLFQETLDQFLDTLLGTMGGGVGSAVVEAASA